jgi:hypothetical protein
MKTLGQGYTSTDLEYAGSPLSAGQIYYWRIKFWDIPGLESPWSSTANFRMTGAPSAATLLVNDQTSPIEIPLEIYFSAIYTDPNSDQSSAYQIQVNTSPVFTGVTMWDSTKTSITINAGNRSPDINYGGTSLSYDETKYYVRMKFWDSDDNESNWVQEQFTTDIISRLQMNGINLNGIKIN